MKPKDTITVQVKAEHIAAARAQCHPVTLGKAPGVPGWSATGFVNPAAFAIRDRLSHRPEGQMVIAVWTSRVRIGEKVFALPPIVDQHEGEFILNGTHEAYEFQLSNKPAEAEQISLL